MRDGGNRLGNAGILSQRNGKRGSNLGRGRIQRLRRDSLGNMRIMGVCLIKMLLFMRVRFA